MRTALRSGWLCVMAATMLVGCPTTNPPRLDTDTARVDSGPLPDSGPPPDSGPIDAFRVDTGGGMTGCSFGGGCDLLSPTSCPDVGGARQACYPGMMMSECATAGSAGLGASCDALNDCDTGLVCLASGTCVAACCGNDDCELGEMCQPLGDADGNPLPNGVGVCNRPTTCTPLPNSCPAMEQCTLTGTDGSTDCAPLGPNTEGMPCGGAAGGLCVEGLGCYGTMGGSATCIRFCRLGMAGDCTGGATCNDSGLGSDMFGLCMGG